METRRKRIDMTSGVIWKQLVKFAIPLFIGNLFQQFYNTIDSIVVGNFIGKEALAAVGSTSSAVNMMVGLFTGLSTGATVVLSQYYGAKDKKGVHDTVHTTIAMTIFCGIILGGAGVLLTDKILVLMKTPDDVFVTESIYLKIYFSGLITLMMYNMGSGILRAVGDSKRPLYYLIICSVLNAILDLLFVAVFKMGVAGAAIATIIAQLLSGLLILRTLIKSEEDIKLRITEIRFDVDILNKIIKVGLPASIQLCIVSFSNMFVQSYINYFGSDVMAGWSAHYKLESFCMMPVQSISISSTTFVAQNIGAGDYKRAEKGVKTTILLGTALQVILVSTLIISKGFLIGLFTKDTSVIQYGKLFINLVTPFCIFSGISNCISGAIRGAGDSRTSTIIMLGTSVVFRQLYMFICRTFFHSLIGISLSFPLAWLLSSVVLLCYFRTGKWKNKSLINKAQKGE